MDKYARHYSCCRTKAASDLALGADLRALSPGEIADVEAKRRRPFADPVDLDAPVTGAVRSPWTSAVSGGLLGSAAGAGLGALVGKVLGSDVTHAAITGGVLGGVQGGRLGYGAGDEFNAFAVNTLRQYPQGQGTYRRVLADYQRHLDRQAHQSSF